MNSLKSYYLLFHFILMMSITSSAQAVCSESIMRVPLQNGKDVVLFSDRNYGAGNTYYYLPGDLHISEIKGRKEFLFQPYHENGADGALMHILITWDLKSEEEKTIKKYLSQLGDSLGIIGGNVAIEQLSKEAFSIVSNNSLGRILSRSLNSKGNLPSHSGSKMALSFNFKDEDALEIQSAMRNPKKLKGTSFRMVYLYQVKNCSSNTGTTEIRELIIEKDLGDLISTINK